MGMNFATWKEVSENPAGNVREVVGGVLKCLSGTKAGGEFFGKYGGADGAIDGDTRIYCEDVNALLKGLEAEGDGKLMAVVALVRLLVSFSLQLNISLAGAKKDFKGYLDLYKRVKDAKFYVNKSFFVRWASVCDDIEQIKIVADIAVDGERVPVGFKFFKSAVFKCLGDKDIDYVSSLMRRAGFRPSVQFFVDCMKEAGCMRHRVTLHNLYLRCPNIKPAREFFDVWRERASLAVNEQALVEKYASARR